MAIGVTSRYRDNKVLLIQDPEGDIRPSIIWEPPPTRSFTYTSYVWSEGDRGDLIAAVYYGDPTFWWLIAHANPEILDWNSVPMGTVIRIPDVDA